MVLLDDSLLQPVVQLLCKQHYMNQKQQEQQQRRSHGRKQQFPCFALTCVIDGPCVPVINDPLELASEGKTQFFLLGMLGIAAHDCCKAILLTIKYQMKSPLATSINNDTNNQGHCLEFQLHASIKLGTSMPS